MAAKELMLTKKQRDFVDNFILTGNGAASAVAAGYPKRSSYNIAYENMQKPHVKKYYTDRLREIDLQTMMQQKEVLQRLTKIARREEKETVVVVSKTRKSYYDSAGKKVIEDDESPRLVEIPTKIQDTNRALELLGKHHRLFADKVEVSEVGVTIVNDIPEPNDGSTD